MTKAGSKPAGKKADPFRQDSPEFALLVKKFQNGEIQPTEKPASARSRFEIFQKFTPDQFRAQYSKAKTLSGVMGKFIVLFPTTRITSANHFFSCNYHRGG